MTIEEKKENGIYTVSRDGNVELTIESLGNNQYRAVNQSTDMTAEIVPIDDYITRSHCIEHKKADKKGRFRASKKLLDDDLQWLEWMLEDKEFIRKSKPVQ